MEQAGKLLHLKQGLEPMLVEHSSLRPCLAAEPASTTSASTATAEVAAVDRGRLGRHNHWAIAVVAWAVLGHTAPRRPLEQLRVVIDASGSKLPWFA